MRPTSRPDGPSCRLDRTLRAVRRCSPRISSHLLSSPLLAVRPARVSHRPNGPSCRLDGTLRAVRSCVPLGGAVAGRGPPDSSGRGFLSLPRTRFAPSPEGGRSRTGLPAGLPPVPRSAARTPRLGARTVRPVVWTGPFALPEVIHHPAPEPPRAAIAPPTPVHETRTARIAVSAESRRGSGVTVARRPSVVVALAAVTHYSAKCRSGSTTTNPPAWRYRGCRETFS